MRISRLSEGEAQHSCGSVTKVTRTPQTLPYYSRHGTVLAEFLCGGGGGDRRHRARNVGRSRCDVVVDGIRGTALAVVGQGAVIASLVSCSRRKADRNRHSTAARHKRRDSGCRFCDGCSRRSGRDVVSLTPGRNGLPFAPPAAPLNPPVKSPFCASASEVPLSNMTPASAIVDLLMLCSKVRAEHPRGATVPA